MATRSLSDAETCAELVATDPFASGIHKIVSADDVAALLASRTKATATFTRGRSAPVLVILEDET